MANDCFDSLFHAHSRRSYIGSRTVSAPAGAGNQTASDFAVGQAEVWKKVRKGFWFSSICW
jgi:hypothetical protein